MEERHIALWVLGIVVVLAIIGLFFLFKSARTGAGFIASTEYPTGGQYGAYSNTNPFPYYQPTYGVSPMEIPGYQNRVSYQHDWAWRTDPEHTYGAKLGRCAILATPQIGKIPAGYIMDANLQEMQNQFGAENCIQDSDALKGWCCKLTTTY